MCFAWVQTTGYLDSFKRMDFQVRVPAGFSQFTRRLGFEIVRGYPAGNQKPFRNVAASPQHLGLISFSLYGDGATYMQGALRNAEQYPRLFPGWGLIFFVGDSVPRDVVEQLEQHPDVTLILMQGEYEGHSSMTWRYLAADFPGVRAVVFRDTDCRPTRRERAAVDEWLLSGRRFHIMRDHPGHRLPIMGGMWGVRPSPDLRMAGLISGYGPDGLFSGDQRFLRSRIYPLCQGNALAHQDQEWFLDGPQVESRPFPVPATDGSFVGQGLDAEGTTRPGHELFPEAGWEHS